MCPDPQLISIYMDGELPSPWKEKLENHMTECSSCREKLENFKRLQGLLEQTAAETKDIAALENEFIESAKERVWRNLESSHRRYSGRIVRQSGRRYNMWKSRLSIPIPAVAAAAVIIALVTVLLIRGNPGNNNGYASLPVEPVVAERTTNLILAAEEQIPGIIPTSDINSVLQYLGIDSPEIIIIKLPETSNFSRYGEPAIIRAADYSGR